MSDVELDEITKSYRLIHIRRSEPRTGTGGPGDLAWLWPVTTVALLGWILLPRKRA